MIFEEILVELVGNFTLTLWDQSDSSQYQNILCWRVAASLRTTGLELRKGRTPLVPSSDVAGRGVQERHATVHGPKDAAYLNLKFT